MSNVRDSVARLQAMLDDCTIPAHNKLTYMNMLKNGSIADKQKEAYDREWNADYVAGLDDGEEPEPIDVDQEMGIDEEIEDLFDSEPDIGELIDNN